MPEHATVYAPSPATHTPDHTCLQINERRANNYEIRFDFAAYKQLQLEQPHLTPQEYQRRLDQLDGRTKNNLLTTLMERFNVQVSQVRFKMVDGKLQHSDHDEPMEDVLIRGQQYRLRNGNPVDFKREETEVLNFQTRQAGLNKGVKTCVSISPRGEAGTDYIHHFFDIDEVQDDGTFTTSRYTLKIPREELPEAARQLDPNFPTQGKDEPLDVFLLRNPIANVPTDKILSVLHQDETAMSLEEFGTKVELSTRELRDYYIKRCRQGAAENELTSIRKSMFKLADLATHKDTFTPDNVKTLAQVQLLAKAQGLRAIIAILSQQELRDVPTNCGLPESGSNAWSVGEFGLMRDGNGTLQIVCKTCGFQYMRTSGILEKGCRLCSGTAGIVC